VESILAINVGKDMWREINTLLTHELEETKVRVGGTHEMIWIVESLRIVDR
jgi:hypothetical protein